MHTVYTVMRKSDMLKSDTFLKFSRNSEKYEKNLLRVCRSRVHKIRFINRPSRNIQTDRKTIKFIILSSWLNSVSRVGSD